MRQRPSPSAAKGSATTMAANLPPSPHPKDEPPPEESPFSAWLLIWTIAIAKLLTLVLILWASHSVEARTLVAATTWPWLLAAALLLGGPLLFRYRLRRVRAKRDQLRRAEWLLDEVGSRESEVGRRRTFFSRIPTPDSRPR